MADIEKVLPISSIIFDPALGRTEKEPWSSSHSLQEADADSCGHARGRVGNKWEEE